MKYIICWVAILTVLLILLPLALGSFSGEKKPTLDDSVFTKKVNVYFHETKLVKAMPLEEYVLGVLMAEMPASFEENALKAQAVAARTYTVNKIKNNSYKNVHNNADICTDFSHCQAYISVEKAKSNWGKNASAYFKKCKNAVLETSGEIMVYDSEPVKAVFHSSSSGKTESAEDVWGGDVPYLVSVDSPGENLSPSHKSEVKKSVKEFKKVFEKYNVNFDNGVIGDIIRTEAGAVKSIEIGNKAFKGTEIRSLFKLRSACFDVKVTNEEIIFNVTGNGHGVGMSQYGANYMASMGYDYDKILKKYYTGVEIIQLTE